MSRYEVAKLKFYFVGASIVNERLPDQLGLRLDIGEFHSCLGCRHRAFKLFEPITQVEYIGEKRMFH